MPPRSRLSLPAMNPHQLRVRGYPHLPGRRRAETDANDDRSAKRSAHASDVFASPPCAVEDEAAERLANGGHMVVRPASPRARPAPSVAGQSGFLHVRPRRLGTRSCRRAPRPRDARSRPQARLSRTSPAREESREQDRNCPGSQTRAAQLSLLRPEQTPRRERRSAPPPQH